MSKVLIGSLTAAYTATEYADGVGGDTPPLGYIYEDDANAKVYQFVKNEGSDDLGENRTCKVNDASAYAVEITDALNDLIQGVRPDGATALAEDEYGYVQIKGNALCINGASARAIVQYEAVVADDDTDKGKVGGVDLDTGTTMDQANIEASLESMHGAGHRVIAQAASDTTDAEVEVELDIPPM